MGCHQRTNVLIAVPAAEPRLSFDQLQFHELNDLIAGGCQ